MSHPLTAATLLFIAASLSTALATADGPDFYAVSGVATDDVLNLRSGPSADAEKFGQIPHDTRGLRNLGCQGLPSIDEWRGMNEKEREAGRKHYWCKVRYQGVEGWVAGRFLREDSGVPAPENVAPEVSGFKMTCSETAAYQVGVTDDGTVLPEDTSIRETLPLTVEVKLQGGSDSTRIVTIVEQSGDQRRKMDASMLVGVAVNGDHGHWLLDLKKSRLRRVEAVAGRSARFAVFSCKPL